MATDTATLHRAYSLRTNHAVHVLGLLVLGVLLKLYVAPDVAVNGDDGLYLYDAKRLLWGDWIMLEYPSRSPAFEYLLAAVIALGDSPIWAARMLMIVLSTGLAASVYLLGRELLGHRGGLVALAFMLLQPFPVMWSLWLKTEVGSALLVVLALTLALRTVDRVRISPAPLLAVGALFGLAWFVRRSIIAVAAAFGLWWLWYRWRHTETAGWRPLAEGTVILGGTVSLIGLGYAVLGRFNPVITWQLFETHGLALFTSGGMGSLGYVPLDAARDPVPAVNGGIVGALCQKCGLNTAVIFGRTMIVTLPVVLVLLVVLRSWFESLGNTFRWALPTVLLAESAIAVFWLNAVHPNYFYIGLALFVLSVAYVWLHDVPDWGTLYDRRLGLLFAVLFALVAGYLYRDRILYVTYFQDLYPYLAVLCAAALIGLYDHADLTRRDLAVGAMLLIAATSVATASAYPYQPGGVNEGGTFWFDIETVQGLGDDIDARVAPDERVFTAQPLYVIESDRRIAGDLSRKYYLFRAWTQSDQAAIESKRLAAELRSGQVPIAIIDAEGTTVLENSDPVRSAFADCYTPANSTRIERTNATLHTYEPDPPACEES